MKRFVLPLRGLASEGAQAIVDDALHGLRSAVTARAMITEQLLYVDYDESQVTRADIHEALRRAHIVHVTPDSTADR